MAATRYLVFDIESIADGELVATGLSRAKTDGQGAVTKYRQELMAKYENDFVPYTYHLPISIAVAKVDAEFRLIDLAVLDEAEARPHVVTENFCAVEKHGRPTLVSFNGRTFDLPLLELAAFRYGLSVPGWFNLTAKSFEQARNRYNLEAHIDLQELLTNFGSTRFTGGLNLAANLLGKPGKMDVEGHMVQDLFDAGS